MFSPTDSHRSVESAQSILGTNDLHAKKQVMHRRQSQLNKNACPADCNVKEKNNVPQPLLKQNS